MPDSGTRKNGRAAGPAVFRSPHVFFRNCGYFVIFVSRSGRVDLVITCTFQHRWVASETLYRFQLPAAKGSREACEPRPERCIPNNEMWVKKRSITHPAGHAEHTLSARIPMPYTMAGTPVKPPPVPRFSVHGQGKPVSLSLRGSPKVIPPRRRTAAP